MEKKIFIRIEHLKLIKIHKINQLAIPILISRFVYAANGIIGMLLIAQLGKTELAAGAIVSSIFMFLLLTSLGMLFPVGIIVGRNFGAQQYKEIGDVVRHGFLLGTLIAIPIIIFLCFNQYLFVFFKQDPQIIKLASSYLKWVALAILPQLWLTALNQLAIGIGRTRFVTVITLLSLPLNIFLGYSLLFGKFNFPNMGMSGYSAAIAISNWIVFIAVCSYYYLHTDYKKFGIFNTFFQFKMEKLLLLTRIGWPISIQYGGELAAFALSTLFIGWFGPNALAAQQIVLQCSTLTMMIPFSIGIGTSILVGQAIGRNDYLEIKDLNISSNIYAIITMLLTGVLFLTGSHLLTSFYMNPKIVSFHDVALIAFQLFLATAFFQIVDAIRNVSTAILRSFHDTQTPMWIGIIAFWIVGIPLGYLFAFKLNWGPAGIRWGFVPSITLAAVFLFFRASEKIKQSQSLKNVTGQNALEGT